MKKSEWYLQTPPTSFEEVDEITARLSDVSKNDLFQFCDVNRIPYITAWSPATLIENIEDVLLSRLLL
jgi:hypothetical protein